METLLEQEQTHYKEIIELLQNKIESLEENIDKQIKYLKEENSDDLKRHVIIDNYAKELEKYKKIIKTPYFGNIKYKLDDNNKVYDIYIGNKNLSNNNEQLVYDWKNIICSAFYDDKGSIKNGELLSKSIFYIKNGKLDIVDKMPTNMPKYMMITSSQNDIIRTNVDHNTMTIGLENTGKTTTLLHRIAYQLYTNSTKFNEKNVIIVSPLVNESIKSYMKELDIDKVSTITFDDIALKTVKKIKKSELSNDSTDENISNYKNSIDYLNALEKFVDNYIIDNLKKPIVFENITISSVDRLSSIYKKSMMQTAPYQERINLFTKKTSKLVKEASDDFRFRAWSKYREELKQLKDNDPRRKEIIAITKKNDIEINSGCINVIKEYFNFLKTSPVTLYQDFINNIEKYTDNVPEMIDSFKKDTIDSINSKKINSFDLAAIMYINYLINGINANEDYKYIFIDDSEKFSETQIFMLKKMFPKAIFNVFGKSKPHILNDIKIDLFELNKQFNETVEEVKKEPFEEVKIEIEVPKEEFIPVEIIVEEPKQTTKEITLMPINMYAISNSKTIIIDDNNILSSGKFEIDIELFEKILGNSDEYRFISSSDIEKVLKKI